MRQYDDGVAAQVQGGQRFPRAGPGEGAVVGGAGVVDQQLDGPLDQLGGDQFLPFGGREVGDQVAMAGSELLHEGA